MEIKSTNENKTLVCNSFFFSFSISLLNQYKILDVDFFPNEKNQHLKFYTST